MSDEPEKKETEYQTIFEMLNEMSCKKAIVILIGFYSLVASVVLFFVYWLTKHK